jgi:hypothetical protein
MGVSVTWLPLPDGPPNGAQSDFDFQRALQERRSWPAPTGRPTFILCPTCVEQGHEPVEENYIGGPYTEWLICPTCKGEGRIVPLAATFTHTVVTVEAAEDLADGWDF